MNTPIPRRCETIEEACDLIEAMRLDGLHGYERDEWGGGQDPRYFMRRPDRFGDRHEICFRFGSVSIMTPVEVSVESISQLWRFQLARWETRHQKKWTAPVD